MTEKFTSPVSNVQFLIIHSEPYLKIEDGKEVIGLTEYVFKYDASGEVLKEAFTNEIITDYDPDPKLVFEMKLKGCTESARPDHPEGS